MSRLERAQLFLITSEGEKLTSTQLTFKGRTNEYIPLATLRYLIGIDEVEINRFLVKHELITRFHLDVEWVNCSDVLPLFGWTPR